VAEFALPKHSKIVKGIDYPLQSETENPKKKLTFIDGLRTMTKILGLIVILLT
jgi:hypothetical protein